MLQSLPEGCRALDQIRKRESTREFSYLVNSSLNSSYPMVIVINCSEIPGELCIFIKYRAVVI